MALLVTAAAQAINTEIQLKEHVKIVTALATNVMVVLLNLVLVVLDKDIYMEENV